MSIKSSSQCEQLVELRRQGLTIRAIAAKTGISRSYVHVLLRNFAGEQPEKSMKKTNSPAPKRKSGTQAPEESQLPTSGSDGKAPETAEETIARLEKELAQAKLERDLYDEIINVAEQKFDIQIRKKAGTKR